MSNLAVQADEPYSISMPAKTKRVCTCSIVQYYWTMLHIQTSFHRRITKKEINKLKRLDKNVYSYNYNILQNSRLCALNNLLQPTPQTVLRIYQLTDIASSVNVKLLNVNVQTCYCKLSRDTKVIWIYLHGRNLVKAGVLLCHM